MVSKKGEDKMKKQRVILAITLIISLAFLLSGMALTGLVIYNGVNRYGALDLPDRKVELRIKNDHINIRSEGKVRSRGAERVLSALDRLAGIAKEQSKYGIIILSEATIPQGYNSENVYSGDPEDYKTAGFYSVDKKMIVVNDAKNADWTMYHEMGHFVDYNHIEGGLISETEEWDSVLKNEYPLTGWDLYYSNPQEYFAESFAYYYSDPDELKSICPRTYEIIEKTVGEYNG